MTSHDIIFFCNERSYFQKNILRKIFFFSYKMDKTTFMKNIFYTIGMKTRFSIGLYMHEMKSFHPTG